MSTNNTPIVAAAMMSLSLVSSVQAEDLPVQGEWQVTKVFINTQTERSLNYQYNDDRLVGRFLSVTPQAISTTLPGGANCQSPTMTEESTTLDSWVATTQAIPQKGAAKTYDLGIDGTAKTQVEHISCASGHFANGDAGGNASLALVNQQVLLNWTDGTIVSLTAVDKSSKPQASFDCTKARSGPEKAICGDRELAALDISVARSYRYYRKEAVSLGNKTLENQLQSQQKAWLNQRNSCNADVQCLKKAMNDRLQALAGSLDGA